MKYFIGYLIKGRAKKYQINLINELSLNFNLDNLNKSIMPHLTLKYFDQNIDAEKLKELEEFLKNFSEKISSFKFDLSGFGDFDKRVIFIRAEDENLDKIYNKFYHSLKKLNWVKWFDKYEKGKHNFHTTLVYAESKEQFSEIEKYLSSRNPKYKLDFDNIAILKKPNNKWILHKEFKIK